MAVQLALLRGIEPLLDNAHWPFHTLFILNPSKAVNPIFPNWRRARFQPKQKGISPLLLVCQKR